MDIYEEVKECHRIGIGGHIRPDGDCIGSCLGLYFYLTKRLPDAEIFVFLEKPRYAFRNIPGIDMIHSDIVLEQWEDMDVFIALDTVPERMGQAYDLFKKAKKTINIDHHISNRGVSSMVNYIVPEASSASELVYDVLNPEWIGTETAMLLYMGIAHDTGVFHFSNTSPKVLRSAAALLEYEFDFSKLIDETFYEKTYVQNLVQGKIVLNSRLYLDGKLIVGSASQELMREYGVSKSDFDGVVNQLRITRGVECAAFFYEMEQGRYKCSLRSSSDSVDCSVIAMQYGGGGHRRAAGYDVESSLSQLEQELVEALQKQMGN